MQNNKELLQRAKKYAFLLLKFRLRSEREIYQRLKRKKFPEEIIQQTLSFLKDKRFIDDNFFAKAWIQARIKKPLGFRRIKQELKLKGLDKEIIDSQISEIRKNYAEEDIVRKISKARFNKMGNIDPKKAKRRIFAYLVRRGFSPEAISDAINQLYTSSASEVGEVKI